MRKANLLLFVLVSTCALPSSAQSDPSLLPETTTGISEHVYAIMGFPNIAIVVGTRGALVVDTGLGPRNGATIARVVKKLSTGGLLYLTTTHFHPEHAAGEAGFPNNTILIRGRVQQQEMEAHGAEMVARFSQQSAQRAELLANVKMRQPDIVFDTEAKVDLGGVTVRLLWLGEAHTKGDELIFVEPDSTLISGDVVQNRRAPSIYGDGGTPTSWIGVLDKLSALNPRHILPDHSDPGDGSLIAKERGFIVDLHTRGLALKRQGVSAEDAGKRLVDEFKAKYPDWPNINGVAGFVQRVYDEDR
jgi:glyoxylase-like metal-dependent hydrolase (beta-lactamase superfamily II)